MQIRERYSDDPIEAICKDLATGSAGQVFIRDEEFLLKLFSFGNDEYSDAKEACKASLKQRVVQLDTGEYATLLDCVESGSRGAHRSADFNAFQQNIIPNVILIGTRPWTSADRVRSISFKFARGDIALHYGEHSQANFEASSGDRGHALHTHVINHGRLDILSAQGGGARVTLRMSVSFRLGVDPEMRSTPAVNVELERGVEISSLIYTSHEILIFFEMSLGVRSRLYDVYISTMAEQQQIESLPNVGEEQFRLRLCYGDWAPSNDRIHPGDVVFRVYDSAQRVATRCALSSWLERRKVWKPAYALASAYLRSSASFDRDQLLRAFAWFEAIPLYKEVSGISGSQITKLAKAARQKADELSIKVEKGRISEVLNELKRRTLKERMKLALDRLRLRFGDDFIPQNTEKDCLKAVEFRNKAAHGDLTTDSYEFSMFARAIDAVQMICFLSMLVDLDLGDAVVELRPTSMHPLMVYKLHP